MKRSAEPSCRTPKVPQNSGNLFEAGPVFGGPASLPPIFKIFLLSCEPSDELQESLGPSGPEIPKKSEKSLPGPPAPGSQKVWKKSRKSPEQTLSRLFPDFSGLFRDFFQTFWDPGAGGPGRLFSDFLGISGPEGARDSCSSRESSQLLSLPWSL